MHLGDIAIGSLDVAGGVGVVIGGFGATEAIDPAHMEGEEVVVLSQNAAGEFFVFATGVATAVGCVEGYVEWTRLLLMVQMVHKSKCVAKSNSSSSSIHDANIDRGRERGLDKKLGGGVYGLFILIPKFF